MQWNGNGAFFIFRQESTEKHRNSEHWRLLWRKKNIFSQSRLKDILSLRAHKNNDYYILYLSSLVCSTLFDVKLHNFRNSQAECVIGNESEDILLLQESLINETYNYMLEYSNFDDDCNGITLYPVTSEIYILINLLLIYII